MDSSLVSVGCTADSEAVNSVRIGRCLAHAQDRQMCRQVGVSGRREIETDRLAGRETDRQADRQADRQTNRQADIQPDKESDRQIGRQTDRQADRNTDIKAGRDTARPTEHTTER